MWNPDSIARRDFLKSWLCVAGAGLWPGTSFERFTGANAQDPLPGGILGRRELLQGLDGMSRVADAGNDPFSGGHNAAAVMAAVFFCREQQLDEETQKEILAFLEGRLLTSPIYEPRPRETADTRLIEGLVEDLDAGIDVLRRAGHNIIFANTCLKALREVPEAATPARIAGLRKMVRSFGTEKAGGPRPARPDTFVGLGDEAKFVQFVFEEYLQALELYLAGKGHHGFAGHLLTVGHALLELRRAGYQQTADKGVEAFWQFVQRARDGAELGRRRVEDAPPQAPTPRERVYWIGQRKRRAGEIVSSHVVKYPNSFFVLAKELPEDALKQRVFAKLYHLTAVS